MTVAGDGERQGRVMRQLVCHGPGESWWWCHRSGSMWLHGVLKWEKRKEKRRKEDIDETATEVRVGGKVGVGRLVVARSGRLVVWWGVICR